MHVESNENVSTILDNSNLNVAEKVNYFSKLWHESDYNFPKFTNVYSKKEKQKCEDELENFINAIKKDIGKKKKSLIINRELEEKYSVAVRTFLKERLYFRYEQLEVLFSNDFLKVSGEFIKMAHRFDQSIGKLEVFQACRNVGR